MRRNNTRRSAKQGEPSAAVMQQAKIGGVANVEFTRPELREKLPMYQEVQDCISGSHAIKKAREKYLPRPNAADTSKANVARYEAYLTRAVFYNVVRRSVFALKGQIFLRDPQMDLPASLEVLKLDCTGENVTLEQVADTVAEHVLSIGRSGLHVDFPTTGQATTREQLADGDIRPTITPYHGREIINWRKALRGSRSVYTLIVLREDYHTGDDGFETKTETQYKVLRLVAAQTVADHVKTMAVPDAEFYAQPVEMAVSANNDVYRLEIWRGSSSMQSSPVTPGFVMAHVYYPTDANGQFLNEIPWQFVGSEKNDDSIDHPPMGDMAGINIGHFRNSADYEETSFLTGQPTPVVSGVTEEWNNNVLKGNIQLGSRGIIPLPNGGTAQLLQAEANGVPYEAMQHKERQMVALGAKLVEQRQVQRTATEAQMEGTADTSILATIAQNVSNAVEWALKKACVFTGDAPDSVSFVLNTEFDLTRMDPAERNQTVQEWVAGAISTEEMRANLRRGGIAKMDDKSFKAAAAADAALRLEAEVTKTKALAAATPQPTQPTGPGAK